MTVGRVVALSLLIVLITVVGAELFLTVRETRTLQAEYATVSNALDALVQENSLLERDLSYYGQDENLKKELRARFNYKEPGESMIIVVPSRSNEVVE